MNSLHRLGTGIAGACLALLMATPVLAHADLATSTPVDGAVLDTAPAIVELTFTEGILQAKSSVRLIGPGGEVGTARPERDGATVIRLEGLALGPGDYTVRWTAGAGDGHVERGTLRFTVTAAPESPAPTVAPPTAVPPSGAPVTQPPASTAAPASPATAVPGTEAPTASPPPDPEPVTASGADVLLPILAALVLVGGVGAFVLRRSRGA